MSQTKIMDFCGTGELLSAMLDDCFFCEALAKDIAGRKVTLVIFAEDDPNEKPPLQAGDQIAWNDGNGWQYVTLKASDLPNMQGNDLKVSICETMNLADSFLKDIRATELAYAENQHKTLWTEADEERAGIIALNGNEGDHYKVFMSLRESRSHEWLDHEDEEAQA